LGDITTLEWFSQAGGHVRVNAFHDSQAGCDATIADPHTYLTNDVLDGMNHWTFDPKALGEACGRIQIDFEDGIGLGLGTLGGDGLKAIVIDTGRDCAPKGTPPPSGPPSRPTPPTITPECLTCEPPPCLGAACVPHDPPPTPTPEPASILLACGALGVV